MGASAPPFGPKDAVVVDRPSRHRGLRVTAVEFAVGTPRIRAYLHTPGWERIAVTATAGSAGEAALRAEDLLEHAQSLGVRAKAPRLRHVDAA